MRAEDIVDSEKFRDWSKEHQPRHEVCVWLAARSALRVLPMAWSVDGPAERSSAARLSVLRCLTISDVASLSIASAQLKKAALTAYVGPYNDLSGKAAHAARAAYIAAEAAANTDGYTFDDAADTALVAAGVSTFSEAVYAELSRDCRDLKYEAYSVDCALWREGSPPFAEIWAQIAQTERSRTATLGDESARGGGQLDWTFWVDWYEDVLAGRPRNIPMMEEIALEVDWDKEPGDVLAQIDEIAAKYRAIEQAETDKNEAVQIDVFRATLFDFSYDALEGVMRAVPLARDWKQLEDPDLLAAFLLDAEELREDLQLFCDALAAEGVAMQGAGIVRTYCSALLSELSRAEDRQKLRVGKLVQYGRMIENARLDPDTQKEFGLLAPALQDNGQAVLDLMRNHFARTLSRFAELRDVGIEDDATHWEVLQGFRDIVRAIQSRDSAAHPPLAKDDAVVLSDIMESVERQLRAMDSTDDDSVLESLKREVNFELAKLGATIAIFRERAVGSEKDLGEAADVALKWQKRGLALWGIVKMLKKGLGLD